MADLIIKPSSGGSLKLQEDGGTDAISINTSGVATLANATITAGTFPAGHVIQQVSALFDPGSSSIDSTSTTYVATGLFLTITPTSAGNDIVMNFHVNGMLNSSSSGNTILQIKRSINGGSYTDMGGSHDGFGFAHTYNTHALSTGIVFTDTDFSSWTTGTIVYKLYFKTNNSSYTAQVFRGNTDNCAWAMEIQR